METSKTLTTIAVFSISLMLAPLDVALAANATPQPIGATKKTETTPAEAKGASQAGAAELSKRRVKLLHEAMVANSKIVQAIVSLEKNDKEAAFKALSDASGKLDVVLARAPGLKLAPIGLRSNTVELEATPAEVKQIVTQAKAQLDLGHVQSARTLLEPMKSEMRILTDALPMETYPAAIKLASKDIQKGDVKNAEGVLFDALSTIVTTEETIPLPPIKAEADALEAEQLIKQDKTKNQSKALALLDQADQQLEVGALLGYGDYQGLKKEISSVQAKIKGKSDAGLFGHLKTLFHDIRNKV